MMNDPQALLPANTGHAILEELSRILNNPFIGATIGRGWAETPGAPFAHAKAAGVNLGHMLTLVIATFPTEATTGTCALEIGPDSVVIVGRRRYRPLKDAAHGGAAFASLIIWLIRMSLADSWDHRMMTIQVSNPTLLPDWLIPKGSVNQTPTDHSTFRFPTAWLSARNPHRQRSTDAPLALASSSIISSQLRDTLAKYVHTHADRPTFSVEQAATYCGLSKRKLQRVLATGGENFRQFANQVRLDKAKSLLMDSKGSVEQIAQHLGYSNTSNFTRAFKRHTGDTPARFRGAAR